MGSLNTWQEPSDYKSRPVAILGAGVLGRRIASCWAVAGYTVHIYDPDERQCGEAVKYYEDNHATYQSLVGVSTAPAKVFPTKDLKSTISNAWHVIECAPEKLDVKQALFAELEAESLPDTILATNSSSIRSSMISEKIQNGAKSRVLNTHYFMPPYVRAVELMTNGSTEPEIFTFLSKRLQEVGLKVFIAKKESTGFIQNRVWAAIKREMLTLVSEGVADPKTADDIFFETIVLPGARPFVAMDLVGLDTVAMIEQTFAQERGLSTTHTVDFLQKEYIAKGRLGLKSDKGGFFAPETNAPKTPTSPRLLVLDNGLSGPVETLKNGEILEYSATGQLLRTIFDHQYLPDGIAVSKEKGRLFWTCMGFQGSDDGMLYSANMDGSDLKQLVSPGTINTPKQITLDSIAEKLYFTDREGLCIWRCDLDGGNLEHIVRNGDKTKGKERLDGPRWPVGIAISHRLGKVFWSQKGHSKAWQGRIFSANIDIPQDQTADDRTDKVCLLEGLPEPIDLEFHEESMSLYWTDRGEMPFGNTLNRLRFEENGKPLDIDNTPLLKHRIVARKFHEAIGLKIDKINQHIYVADLGGSICRCNMDGSQKTRLLFDESRAFTGIALV